MSARDEVLDGAKAAINGPRQESYGDAKASFQRIADLWTAIGLRREVVVDAHTIQHWKLTAADPAMALAQLKLARLVASPDHFDSWMDLAGYAALGAEVAGARPMVDTLGHPITPKPAQQVDDRIIGGWRPTHRIGNGTYQTHRCRLEKLVGNRAYVTILDKHDIPIIADLPLDYLTLLP